jgi:hypothetical protein
MTGHHDFENGYKRGYSDGRSEMKENPIPWHLIRAAPDLLEALEAMLSTSEEVAGMVQNKPTKRELEVICNKMLNTSSGARAAIAKAKGEKE